MARISTIIRQPYIKGSSVILHWMALDGLILEVDATPFKEMCRLLRSISNNFNQVAKRANSSGNVYETDLLDMAQKRHCEIFSVNVGLP